MPGMLSRLMHWFRMDVSVDPDSGRPSTKHAGQVPFVGDEEGKQLWETFQDYLAADQNRNSLYNVYDQMDHTDIIGGILDMHAEDATPVDQRVDRSIWVDSENKDIETEANNLLIELGTDEDANALARGIAKYGDFFWRNVYVQDEGILAAHSVHPRLVFRKEDKVRKLLGFKQDGKKFRNQSSALSWPWDYVHFRMRGRDLDGLYGTSILYNLIRPWRQLVMAEDYSLLYQISRHPDRNMFMIDIGANDEAEGQKLVRRFKEAMRYQLHKDPKNKEFSYRYSPMTPMEDIFLGVRPNSQTRVEKLTGSSNANDASNLMYYVNKIFAVSRVPKTTFGYEGGDAYNPKQAVTNQDIRYAKNVSRIQRAIKAGIRTMLEIHFIVRGNMGLTETISEADENKKRRIYREKLSEAMRRGGSHDFTVKMAPVSYLEELQRLELDQTRWQVADAMIQTARDHNSFDSRSWVAYILKTYARLSDSRIGKVLVDPNKAKDREGYWYGGQGEMPHDQKKAMAAQSQATIAQSQLQIAQADQAISGEAPDETAATLAKEDRDHGSFDTSISSEEKQLIDEIVKRNPRIRVFIERARELFSDEGHSRGERMSFDGDSMTSSARDEDFYGDET